MTPTLRSLILCTMLTYFLASCYSHHEGMLSRQEASFIRFTGNCTSAIVSIDGSAPAEIRGPTTEVYQVVPGIHTVTAHRDGKLVLNRKLFIDNGITMEVAIP